MINVCWTWNTLFIQFLSFISHFNTYLSFPLLLTFSLLLLHPSPCTIYDGLTSHLTIDWTLNILGGRSWSVPGAQLHTAQCTFSFGEFEEPVIIRFTFTRDNINLPLRSSWASLKASSHLDWIAPNISSFMFLLKTQSWQILVSQHKGNTKYQRAGRPEPELFFIARNTHPAQQVLWQSETGSSKK